MTGVQTCALPIYVLSIFDAAARANTLVFMLTGIGMLIPVMIIYNAYQYLVFRGKVSEQEGYK